MGTLGEWVVIKLYLAPGSAKSPVFYHRKLLISVSQLTQITQFPSVY